MKLITHIDAAVLGWHQGVVDFLQVRPLVLGRCCFIAMLLLGIARWWLRAPTSLNVVAGGVLFIMLGVLTLSEPVFAFCGRRLEARMFILCSELAQVFVLGVLAALLLPPDLHRGVTLLFSLPMVAFFFFAACRPPRPRPPRRAASLAGGEA